LTSHLTLPRLWAAAALVCIFVAVSFTWVYPADFWWHLRYGQDILNGQGIPTVDRHSFIAEGQPYLYQYWLSSLIFAVDYNLGGLPRIVFLNAFVFTLAYGLSLQVCSWRAGGSLRIAVAGLAAGFLLSVENWAFRPQTYSLLLFSFTVWLLWRYVLGRGRARTLVLLPAVTALWANLHGTFPLGLALQGIFILGWMLQKLSWLPLTRLPDVSIRPLLAAGVASLLATLATPYGFGLYGYVAIIIGNPAIRTFVVEWQPTTLGSTSGKVLAGMVTLTIFLAALTRKKPDAPTVLGVLIFGWLATQALRNVIWFGFILAPLFSTLLDAALTKFRGRIEPALARFPGTSPAGASLNNALALAVATFLILVAIASTPWVRPNLPLPDDRHSLTAPDTPIAAAQALKQEVGSHRVFADMQYASYLIWALPESRVFVDPRIELYPYAQWEEYGTMSDGLDTELLDQIGVNALLLSKERQRGLIQWVIRQRGWRQSYEDNRSAVWVKASQ